MAEVSIYEIRNKKGMMILFGIIAFICFVIWYVDRKNKQKKAISNFFEYEGDNYDGTYSYIGDKEDLQKGRQNAYAARTYLFKISEPALVLKHERNRQGEYRMIQTGRKYSKGTQMRIFEDSLKNPIAFHGINFVQNIKGEFIRMDKLTKV